MTRGMTYAQAREVMEMPQEVADYVGAIRWLAALRSEVMGHG